MGFHTFDPESADRLEDESRYRYLSREELVGALALGSGRGDTVADLGSGTGFYTDDVAPFAGEVRAIDVQAEMHELFREKGVPENVELVTADVGDLPFADGELDAAFSTMTFHEFAGDGHGAEAEGGTEDGAGDGAEEEARTGAEDDAETEVGPGAETEVARVLADGGRFVVADWSANGDGESGPPVSERYDRDEAVELLESANFEVLRADERPETFFVVAER
ncbi:class I SAM-dependent methyltransferase [Halorussus sp. MSC15.2]|uniref:class I SAM-dependent methyltransferase n=1 Tax=Halorussus sp. MSC15.2 TaxID=2283638 RepID=UPI0013D7F23E|nr:class I SAM-dependent methyltransferase [Halorussus sp. MSC15.2]NEU58310.1 methyltransferase domain-containing protein [Halorussus sp. MSC15.2]